MSLTRDQLTNLFNGITRLSRTSTLTLKDLTQVEMMLSGIPGGGALRPAISELKSAFSGGADIDDDKHLTLDEFLDYGEQHQA